MVYTQANPERTPEVLQYMEIITTAAQSFVWENIAQYDFAFRKLLAKHPNRSWARTHPQMWTLYLKDHINVKNPGGKRQRGDWKENVCWRFNKGKCQKSATNCNFEHRCSSCGAFSHSLLTCRKRRGSSPSSRGRDNPEEHHRHKSKKERRRSTSPKSTSATKTES